jgi:hypothetical protein
MLILAGLSRSSNGRWRRALQRLRAHIAVKSSCGGELSVEGRPRHVHTSRQAAAAGVTHSTRNSERIPRSLLQGNLQFNAKKGDSDVF